jgi:acetyl-CoA carboxylase biotin carboxyl carrier protein
VTAPTPPGASAPPPQAAAITAIYELAGALLPVVRQPLRRLAIRSGEATLAAEWAPPSPGPAVPGPLVPGRAARPGPAQHGPDAGAQQPGGPQPAGSPVAGSPVAGSPAGDGQDLTVDAPLVGVFRISRGPDDGPFVRAGDVVEPGQQVGVITTMNQPRPVRAGAYGRIAQVLVPDETFVEYAQPLLRLTACQP